MDLNAFESIVQGNSITKTCKREERNVLGTNVIVVDTPGLFDTSTPNIDTVNEILRCMCMIAPGPHAVLLTISISEHLTPEVVNSLKIFFHCFGEQVKEYVIVVFTKADQLKSRRETKTIETFVNEIDIKEVLQLCGMRYIAFNNTHEPHSKENEDQVKALLHMVQQMVIRNGGSHFTNELLQAIQKQIQARIEAREEEELIRMLTGISMKAESRAREEAQKAGWWESLKFELGELTTALAMKNVYDQLKKK